MPRRRSPPGGLTSPAADVYATAALARGADALDWLATLDGHAALLVDATGRARTTPNWPGTRLATSLHLG